MQQHQAYCLLDANGNGNSSNDPLHELMPDGETTSRACDQG